MHLKYSSQTKGVQAQPKMLSTHTLVYELKISIPFRFPCQAKIPPAFLLKICKVSPCLRGGLAGKTYYFRKLGNNRNILKLVGSRA